MNFLDLQATIRHYLWKNGFCELPGYGRPLPAPFSHPDLFFRLFTADEFHFCLFQAVEPDQKERRADLGKAAGILDKPLLPSLIIVKKPFSIDLFQAFPRLLRELFNEGFRTATATSATAPSESTGGTDAAAAATAAVGATSVKPAALETWGYLCPSGFLYDQGPAWNIGWKGYPIGKARVLSGLCDVPLAQPTGLLQIDLAALWKLGTGEFSCRDIPWNSCITAPELAVFSTPSCLLPLAELLDLTSLRIDELKSTLERMLAEERFQELYQTVLELHFLVKNHDDFRPGATSLYQTFTAAMKPILKKIPAHFAKGLTAGRKPEGARKT